MGKDNLFSGRKSNVNTGKGIAELDAVSDKMVRDFQSGKGVKLDL